MEGLCRAVLGTDLGFFNGGQVSAADCQQSPTAGKRNRKSSSKHDGYRSRTITQSYCQAQQLALKSEEISVYQAFHPKGRQNRAEVIYPIITFGDETQKGFSWGAGRLKTFYRYICGIHFISRNRLDDIHRAHQIKKSFIAFSQLLLASRLTIG